MHLNTGVVVILRNRKLQGFFIQFRNLLIFVKRLGNVWSVLSKDVVIMEILGSYDRHMMCYQWGGEVFNLVDTI